MFHAAPFFSALLQALNSLNCLGEDRCHKKLAAIELGGSQMGLTMSSFTSICV
jgi:hypothetical protein